MLFIVAATIEDDVDGEDDNVFIYDVVALSLCPRGAICALVFVNMNNERRLICGHRAVAVLAEIAMAGGTVRTVPPNMFSLCCAKKLGEVDEYARIVVARVAMVFRRTFFFLERRKAKSRRADRVPGRSGKPPEWSGTRTRP